MAYQAPKGTSDLFGPMMDQWQKIESIIRENCELFHVQEIRTPVFEHTEVFKRQNDSSDVVNKEMYTFLDYGKRSITLRPEGTAGAIRALVQHKLYAQPDLPAKYFYIGPNFRYEQPQKGRSRIHHQFGVEVIGVKEPLVDVEVISLGIKTLNDIGLKSFKVHLNSLGDEASRVRYRQVLKDHFTPVLDELCEDCHRRYEQNPLRILDCKVDKDHPSIKNAPSVLDYLNDDSKAYFEAVKQGLTSVGIDFVVDDRIVRGLDYYTHTVFEIISTHPEMGAQSTIMAGGRYDLLVEYFGGPSMGAVGFGTGIERILVACEAEGVVLTVPKELSLYGMPLCVEAEATVLKLINECRLSGIDGDMDYQHRSMKSQFKTTDRNHAILLLIAGEDEIANGVVTIKNTRTKAQKQVRYEEVVDECVQQLGAYYESEN